MEALTRRKFLAELSAAALAASTLGAPRTAWCGEKAAEIKPAADRVILLWMSGGMAHTETFDPKRHVDFEKDLDPDRVLATFPSIPTAVDGLRISSGLERLASVMDRGAVIRSYRAADLGFILHTRHQYHWHTGYVPPQTIAMPHIGAIIANMRGQINPDVPAFIHIGQRLELPGSEEIKAYLTAGYLGAEHGPFVIPDAIEARRYVSPPAGVSPARFEDRNKFFRRLVEASESGRTASSFHQESMLRSLDGSYRLLHSPAARAFDITDEPPHIYEEYDTGRFGLGCLLARRLCEVGARFIEVTSEWVQFDNWDTHNNGHTRTIEMKRWIDRPVTRLILDLEERGLLDRTLIILASEFSRDLMIEGRAGVEVKAQARVPERINEMRHYGLHKHFTGAGSAVLFGGGVKRGLVYGSTSDERPCEVVTDEIRIEDLHASIFHLLGIPPDHSFEVEKRPIYVTRDGVGKARSQLFASA